VLESFRIDDPIVNTDDDYVEVTIILSDKSHRWCFFMTPAYLNKALGGYHPDAKTRLVSKLSITSHTLVGESLVAKDATQFGMLSAPHMILVSQLSEEIIAETLRYLDQYGELEQCTKPLHSNP
jgi:hypothetical protein